MRSARPKFAPILSNQASQEMGIPSFASFHTAMYARGVKRHIWIMLFPETELEGSRFSGCNLKSAERVLSSKFGKRVYRGWCGYEIL